MISPHDLLPIAREAQRLARNAGTGGSPFFHKVAAVSVCIVAVATGMHALKEVYRILHADERHLNRGR